MWVSRLNGEVSSAQAEVAVDGLRRVRTKSDKFVISVMPANVALRSESE